MIDPKQFATELRIGNWLNPSEPEYKGKYFQIQSGDIKHIQDGMRIYKYEAIPLSAEVLEACGFLKGGDTKWRLEDNELIYLYQGNGFYIPNILPEVTSLHQLQNIFYFVTGKELTYNPSK